MNACRDARKPEEVRIGELKHRHREAGDAEH